jgi:hypothetical protein
MFTVQVYNDDIYVTLSLDYLFPEAMEQKSAEEDIPFMSSLNIWPYYKATVKRCGGPS